MTVESEIRETRTIQCSALLTAFFELADEWKLSVFQQGVLLGDDALARLNYQMQYDLNIDLKDNTLARLVTLSGLRKKLKSSFSIGEANLFLRESQVRLGCKTPLDIILDDPDEGPLQVRKFLFTQTVARSIL